MQIANTQMEWECESGRREPLATSFLHHPFYLQLQFLPALYSEGDTIGVTHFPREDYFDFLTKIGLPVPHMKLLSDSNFSAVDSVDSWGASQNIADWATQHELSFPMPPWDIVKEVNAKTFSFSHSEPIEGSALLTTKDELLAWCKTPPLPKVLKTCFGFSGRGHLLILGKITDAQIVQFAEREWTHGRPVIGEVWVRRILDFSTQWKIAAGGAIDFLGATVCENDGRGGYRGTKVGELSSLFGPHIEALHKHKEKAFPLLELIAKRGYFGNIGVDAFLGEDHLRAVVEVNARKTMGWVALELQRRFFPEKSFTLSLMKPLHANASMHPLLPSALHGSSTSFTHQLYLHFDI